MTSRLYHIPGPNDEPLRHVLVDSRQFEHGVNVTASVPVPLIIVSSSGIELWRYEGEPKKEFHYQPDGRLVAALKRELYISVRAVDAPVTLDVRVF